MIAKVSLCKINMLYIIIYSYTFISYVINTLIIYSTHNNIKGFNNCKCVLIKKIKEQEKKKNGKKEKNLLSIQKLYKYKYEDIEITASSSCLELSISIINHSNRGKTKISNFSRLSGSLYFPL